MQEAFSPTSKFKKLYASSFSSSASSAKKRKFKFHSNSKAYVQYHTLVAEEGSNVPLREYINAEFLNPVPPPDPLSSEPYFDLGDVVACLL